MFITAGDDDVGPVPMNVTYDDVSSLFLEVPIIQDDDLEEDEAFFVVMSIQPTPLIEVDDDSSVITVIIIDDDVPAGKNLLPYSLLFFHMITEDESNLPIG